MKLLAGFAVLATVACASAPRSETSQESGTDQERMLARARDERAAKLEEALTALPVGDNCPRACSLVVDICNLAKRICATAIRKPDDAELPGRCGGAEERCQRSRERAAAGCSCGAQ